MNFIEPQNFITQKDGCSSLQITETGSYFKLHFKVVLPIKTFHGALDFSQHNDLVAAPLLRCPADSFS